MEDHDIDVLARTIWGEARGEPYEGKIAVAWTAKNRALIAQSYEKAHGKAHQHYGDGSLASACQAKWQYSCWNSGDPNLIAMESVTPETSASFRDCLAIAKMVADGVVADPVKGSTHYYAVTIDPPAWAVGHTPVVQIGHHLFFAGIPA